jgi:hypothetical protein
MSGKRNHHHGLILKLLRLKWKCSEPNRQTFIESSRSHLVFGLWKERKSSGKNLRILNFFKMLQSTRLSKQELEINNYLII